MKEKLQGLGMLLCWGGFMAMGLVQLASIYAFFSDHWGWSFILAGAASFVLAYIPLVGSICGCIGAVKAWGWGWWQAGLLFFWWPVLVTVMSVVGGGVAAVIKNKTGTEI